MWGCCDTVCVAGFLCGLRVWYRIAVCIWFRRLLCWLWVLALGLLFWLGVYGLVLVYDVSSFALRLLVLVFGWFWSFVWFALRLLIVLFRCDSLHICPALCWICGLGVIMLCLLWIWW